MLQVALAILEGDMYPSIGHMAAQNMTTLCENWACTFHEAGGGSGNHVSPYQQLGACSLLDAPTHSHTQQLHCDV